ncbi:DUF5305 family protein [Sinomonas terrae]|uniref:DUF5305 domain-containing protein n=1 Tax=Sinomonas terrae TaxID=2908838 RepID=A0ABS9U398_9MICC|nr:DUF5305 family protein [Sinomonas terrae]MCH6471166.1 DUF5305 domain-containing protein [Sinomonas terrae]
MTFQPVLKLNLTPLQLTLAGDLTVTDTAAAASPGAVPRALEANGWNLTAADARVLSAVLLLAALLGGTALGYLSRRPAPGGEGAAIRRRYASLLVRVRPVTTAPGRPVIDVTSFATLAKLAQRYGLLVLHWTRSGIETFIVQDENNTYRYRTGAQAPEPEASRTQDHPSPRSDQDATATAFPMAAGNGKS